ncbi:MAG TPA: hypothetical protein VGN42_15095 [Pirellulales bacterium]|jgi:hypothetical protein|nr:hypothetical protein [Pirellulales bacterium]
MKAKPNASAAAARTPRGSAAGVVIHCRFKERRRGRSLHQRGKPSHRAA